ncbi:MAG: molybdopterin oxidoreductase family protein [Magnetospirillum sp. WYHS-4]
MPASRRPDLRPPTDGLVRCVCPHDCADTCGVLAHVRSGRLVKVEGDPDHPVTQGFLCRKLSPAPQRVYGGERLATPLRRCGPKGSGEFEPLSWEAAIAEIAARWKAIIAKDGPLAILPFFGSGTEGLVHGEISGKRFFNRLGTLQPIRTICTRAGRTGYKHTMGTNVGADPTALEGIDLVVAWGLNAASTHIHQHPFFRQAARRGARFAVVNPLAVAGAEKADLFLRPRPGTDGALALAMMNVIVAEGRHDQNFVTRFTHGFEAFRERLADYPPEKVATIADIPAEEIRAFARLYAAHPRSFVFVGPGCQRHSNGGMALRTLACLPALTGALAHKGGGLYFPTSTVFPADFHPLTGDELRPNPAAGYNMIHLGRMLEDGRSRSLYVCMGNPATVLYDQNRLRRGLAREDLFTVVHDIYPTDTARFADIVLPCTTQFEQADLLFSYYQPSLLLTRPAIAPVGEARSNQAVFNALAAAMDFDDPCFRQDEWDAIEEILGLPAFGGLDREALLDKGWAPVSYDDAASCVAKGWFPTASGKVELWSSSLESLGLDPLPHWRPPHESREGSPDLFASHPLAFLTPSAHSIHNSSQGFAPGFAPDEKEPRLHIHPADAEPRGIRDGDRVRVFNGRGECILKARVSEFTRPGVVASPGQWWDRLYAKGSPNHTTSDTPADMGGGSSFNSNLVEVERNP